MINAFCEGMICVKEWFVWMVGLCEGMDCVEGWLVWRDGLCERMICVNGWFLWRDGMVCVTSLHTNHTFTQTIPSINTNQPFTQTISSHNQPFTQSIPSHNASLHTNHVKGWMTSCLFEGMVLREGMVCVKGWFVWRDGLCHFPDTIHHFTKPSLDTNHLFTQNHPFQQTIYPSLYYILSGLYEGIDCVTCIHPFTWTS